MGWWARNWTRLLDKIVGDEPPDRWPPEPSIIRLARGSSWEDYPQEEVMQVFCAYSNAEIVIDVFGNVIKDRYKTTPRPATEEELRYAVTV